MGVDGVDGVNEWMGRMGCLSTLRHALWRVWIGGLANWMGRGGERDDGRGFDSRDSRSAAGMWWSGGQRRGEEELSVRPTAYRLPPHSVPPSTASAHQRSPALTTYTRTPNTRLHLTPASATHGPLAALARRDATESTLFWLQERREADGQQLAY